MNNVFKNFAILVILTTGCSSQQQSQLPINTINNSTPVVQQVQASSVNSTNIPTPSNQWVSVAQSSNGDIVSVDTGSLTRNGDITSFWFQTNYTVPPKPGLAVSRIYANADCRNGLIQSNWIVQADNQGQILLSNKTTDPPTRFAPTSTGAIVSQFACNNQSDPALQAQAAQAQITQAQLEALTKRNQASAEAISEAMRIGASLAK